MSSPLLASRLGAYGREERRQRRGLLVTFLRQTRSTSKVAFEPNSLILVIRWGDAIFPRRRKSSPAM